MHIPWITEFIVFAQAAPAGGDVPAGGDAPAGGGGSLLESFFPIIMIFAIFWFLIIRPQSKKQKEIERKVRAAQKGDSILTHGGIYGKIVKATDEDIVLEVDKHSKTRIQFSRTAIRDIIDSAPAEEEDAPEPVAEGTEENLPPIPNS